MPPPPLCGPGQPLGARGQSGPTSKAQAPTRTDISSAGARVRDGLPTWRAPRRRSSGPPRRGLLPQILALSTPDRGQGLWKQLLEALPCLLRRHLNPKLKAPDPQPQTHLSSTPRAGFPSSFRDCARSQRGVSGNCRLSRSCSSAGSTCHWGGFRK